jgi:amino acid adenylation domain-containing protein
MTHSTITARFAATVAAYPDAIAVETDHATLTYAELSAYATAFAHAITDRAGTGRNAVAILVENDVWAPAAILGALMAGKPYVPISVTEPDARIQFLIEDSRADTLIALRESMTRFQGTPVESIALLPVEDVERTDARPYEPRAQAIAPDDLACIIYTSGSTGAPKGVMQTHATLLNGTDRNIADLGVTNTERVACARALSFNGALKDFYVSLLSGSTLCLFDSHRQAFSTLPAWMIEHCITIVFMAATTYRGLVAATAEGLRYPALRGILIGGEALTPVDAAIFQKTFEKHCRLYLAFGTSETSSVARTIYTPDSVPANLPTVTFAVMPGITIRIVDSIGSDVAPGETGEIVVCGPHLTPGYWQRPELNAERFATMPGDPTMRMYRTGDLGRFMADGTFEHQGRIDAQVKIHGQRIELGEVDTALRKTGYFRQVAVRTYRDGADVTHIVAYVVPENGRPTITTIRTALRRDLPSIMIPSRFVVLDDIPQTSGGKVDLQRLPAPGNSRPQLEVPYAAPGSFAESFLCDVWSEILEVEEIGIHDPFLELGGDSLRAMRVVAHTSDRLAVDIPLEVMIASPTVAELATWLEQALLESADADELPLLQQLLGDADA